MDHISEDLNELEEDVKKNEIDISSVNITLVSLVSQKIYNDQKSQISIKNLGRKHGRLKQSYKQC